MAIVKLTSINDIEDKYKKQYMISVIDGFVGIMNLEFPEEWIRDIYDYGDQYEITTKTTTICLGKKVPAFYVRGQT